MPEVTIIIPSYNHQGYIRQRLDSIKNQSFKDWEAIIIDDASTDNSLSIIEVYLKGNKDFKVKHFIKNDFNSGSGYKSWQKGIELAETEFIWIAETDDYSNEDFLETTIGALATNPSAVMAFTASNYVDKDGEFLYNTNERLSKLSLKQGESGLFSANVIIDGLPLNPLIINGSSVLFRKPKKPLSKIIFENKQLSDLFLWTHLLKDSFFVCINSPLNNFRRHEASTTTLNFRTDNSKVYDEYCNYIDHFNLHSTKSIEVLDHYIKFFLIPNRKALGYFYTEPIKGLKSVSRIKKWNRIIIGYINYLKKKL